MSNIFVEGDYTFFSAVNRDNEEDMHKKRYRNICKDIRYAGKRDTEIYVNIEDMQEKEIQKYMYRYRRYRSRSNETEKQNKINIVDKY